MCKKCCYIVLLIIAIALVLSDIPPPPENSLECCCRRHDVMNDVTMRTAALNTGSGINTYRRWQQPLANEERTSTNATVVATSGRKRAQVEVQLCAQNVPIPVQSSPTILSRCEFSLLCVYYHTRRKGSKKQQHKIYAKCTG